MNYLDETTPADSEAVTLGASRIRQLKVNIDAALDQLFEGGPELPSAGGPAPAFLPGWITKGGASGGVSMFTPGAVQTADIAPSAVTAALLASGAVGAAALAETSITVDKLATGFVVPAASVNTAAIQALAVGTSQIALGAVTGALLASGLVKGAAIGTYAGSNSASAAISGLSFTPTVILLLPGRGIHGFGVSFLGEVSAGSSPIHCSWIALAAIASPYLAAVQWSSSGFTIVPDNMAFNLSGQTHTYLALAI